MRRRDENRVLDYVDANFEGDTHELVIPRDELSKRDIRTTFDALGRAIQRLAPFAKYTDFDDLSGCFVYAHRRWGRIFDVAYDTEDIKKYRLKTHRQIHNEMLWTDGDPIPPRTYTIEKTVDELRLKYEPGFHASGDVCILKADESDEEMWDALRACGKAVDDTHAPFEPVPFESWRYKNGSKIQFSIEGLEDPSGIRIGVESEAPSRPLWYPVYNWMSVTGGPYSNITFDLSEQTSTVRYHSEHAER